MADKKQTTNKRVIPEGKTQFNFNADSALLYKAKYIALEEQTSTGEILNTALAKHIEEWESSNGKIKPRKKS